MNDYSPLAKRQRGFTLMELLIAIAIFAIVGVLAMSGYNQLVKQREIAAAAMARVRAVQRSMMRISQDFEQLEPRPIRDATGASDLPALYVTNNGVDLVELTHAGWTNPTGINRSTLQRVRYRLLDGKLYRDYWSVLDRNLNNVPIQVQLLDKVTAVTLRYMDTNHQWQTTWPPGTNGNNNANNANTTPRALPLGVEVTLSLKDWGEIKRIIEVPNL